DFDSFAPAFAAALALVEALGDDKFTGIFRGSTLDVLSDSFAIPFGDDPPSVIAVFDLPVLPSVDSLVVVTSNQEEDPLVPWAVFEQQQAVSTPEPSLILGFITLSGLMLGGRRNTKKAKA
ncbi:MAG: hypothetical protein F6K39_38995, partial [Okeania sp. SIO3B3]|nr:hypothetical protein [Okeania sp. SIO3B3]